MAGNFDLTMSPRAQGYQSPQGGDDEDAIFKKGFGDLAFRALTKSFPELGADVVTFRVLDAKAEEGQGIGAFILKLNTELLYVPVVVTDNAVKPLDMFYSRSRDKFYPLSPDYLRYMTKGVMSGLGEPTARPPTLRTDTQLRQPMPATMMGRGVYASSDEEDPGAFLRSVRMSDGHEKRAMMLPTVLSQAPNNVKLGFERFLTRNPAIRARALEVYGKTVLASMLAQTVKSAATQEVKMKHDVFLMTAATPINEAKEALGSETGIGFKSVALKGFYIKDKRKKTESLFALAERPLELSAPSAPGLFRVFMSTGKSEIALIVPNPVCIDMYGHEKMVSSWHGSRSKRVDTRYLVILKDGRNGVVNKIVGEPVVGTSSRDIEKFLGSLGEKPKNDAYGCLISVSGMTVKASEPFKAEEVMSDGQTSSFKGRFGCGRIILDHRLDTNRVIAANDDGVWQFGGRFQWLDLKDDKWSDNKEFPSPSSRREINKLDEKDFLSSQEQIFRAAETELMNGGGEMVEAKTAGASYIVGNDGKLVSYPEALCKIARRYNASIPDAEAVLKLAQARDRSTIWVLKRAADDKGAPPEQDPNAAPPMDPSMMAAMAGPPQPAPLDLAVSEQMQMLQQQQASLAQMMQLLQSVQMRTQQISMGGGQMAAPMAAASMMAGPAQGPGGMPAMAPVGGMMGAPMGGDPSQMGGQPGMQQGMDPSQMGGQPGMDPSQQGMDPSMGGDPSMMQQQPPAPVMTEAPTPDNIAAQINPDFMGDAANMAQDDVFDAAAVASIAGQKNLRDLTQAYVPTLERALDNLGRILLLFYVHATVIKEQLGGDEYTDTEQRLRDVFKGLGEVLTKVDLSASQLLPDSVNQG